MIEMRITEKNIQDHRLQVSIFVEKEEFDRARKKAYMDHTDKYPVQGSAGGLASLADLEKTYGPAVLYDEALDDVVPEMFNGFLKKEGLRIVGRPEMNDMKFQDGGVLFSVKADLYPDVELGQYRDLKVPYIRAGEQDLFERAVIREACGNMTGEIPPHMVELKMNSIMAREKLNVCNEAIYHLLADAERILKRGYEAAEVYRRPSQIKEESMDLMLETVSEEHQDDWKNFFKERITLMAERYHSPLPGDYDSRLDKIIADRIREKNEMDKDELIEQVFQSYLDSLSLSESEWKKKRYSQAAREVCVDLLLDKVASEEELRVDDQELHSALEEIAAQVNMTCEEVEEKMDVEPVRQKMMRDKALVLILDSAATDEEGRRKRIEEEEKNSDGTAEKDAGQSA